MYVNASVDRIRELQQEVSALMKLNELYRAILIPMTSRLRLISTGASGW